MSVLARVEAFALLAKSEVRAPWLKRVGGLCLCSKRLPTYPYSGIKSDVVQFLLVLTVIFFEVRDVP